ncbi:hypothetical protein [Streptomyces sp. CS62]|uniref:hypothetical protein n=1 Tax=Streptomyces sp. CS62 TaxID=3119268 RepID=UPI002F95AB71
MIRNWSIRRSQWAGTRGAARSAASSRCHRPDQLRVVLQQPPGLQLRPAELLERGGGQRLQQLRRGHGGSAALKPVLLPDRAGVQPPERGPGAVGELRCELLVGHQFGPAAGVVEVLEGEQPGVRVAAQQCGSAQGAGRGARHQAFVAERAVHPGPYVLPRTGQPLDEDAGAARRAAGPGVVAALQRGEVRAVEGARADAPQQGVDLGRGVEVDGLETEFGAGGGGAGHGVSSAGSAAGVASTPA